LQCHLQACQAVREELRALLAVNRALGELQLAVVMAMHVRLGAESGLNMLDADLFKVLCGLFCSARKAECRVREDGVAGKKQEDDNSGNEDDCDEHEQGGSEKDPESESSHS
jgi:hypothetical protein